MKRLLFPGALFLGSFCLNAQGFDLSLLAKAKKIENVDAVYLTDETVFNIENKGLSKTKKHWAILINNKTAAKDFTVFSAYFDSFSKIKNLEGYLYDENGVKKDKIRKRDSEAIKLGVFDNAISDTKLTYAEFEELPETYPYVVEFSFEKEDENMMFYPTWIPLQYEDVKVLKSSLIINSNQVPFRFKGINLAQNSVESDTSNSFYHKWVIEDYGPLKFEKYSLNNHLVEVHTAPQDFLIEKREGHFRKWEDLSSFYHELNKDRDELPAEKVAEVSKLISPGMNTFEKVKAVYEFMQAETRYVSVQLGIGGWQSSPADQVATLGYGDCKALTNYTNALLKAVGITAYPALIKSGSKYNHYLEDFPSMNFNHVISCVPMGQDTLWLECTSQTESAGYLGDFTGNRKALLIKPEGGVLVNTTAYLPSENFQKRKAEVWLNDDGSAKMKVSSSYGGLQHDRRAYIYTQKDQEEIDEYLLDAFPLTTYEVNQSGFELKKGQIPSLDENLELTVRKLAPASGKRIFLKPSLLSGFMRTPPKEDERQTRLFLNPNSYAFEDTDEITFHLPEGLKIESHKEAESIESKFGSYQNSISREGNKLIYRRNVMVKGGHFSKEDYADWVLFVKKVNKADRSRIVFTSDDT
ncbi:DUF3857 domain-containing protein [Jiulongibacter sp. NS-SX5]|uniref:DUF3857 domain-containing protein n=1 Tax=Jiulongibacter sp. NS-SX5 TaxID=3463854 RepID=UPI0040589422